MQVLKILGCVLLFWLAGLVSAFDVRHFDGTRWKLSFRPGEPGVEQVKTLSAPLEPGGRALPAVAWGSPCPSPIEMSIQDLFFSLDAFERAEFILTVRTSEAIPLRRIMLRFADCQGEVFQFAPERETGLAAGENELRYPISPAHPESFWGGLRGNKKIDWPLRFAGIAIEKNQQTPNGKKILLDSLKFRPLEEYALFSLRTGHRLNLLLPERTAPPEFAIQNYWKEPLALTGELNISDADGNARVQTVSCKVAPGREKAFPLSGSYDRQGWWKVDYHLKSASGKEFRGEHRFARINPAGPTPERARGFLFSVCGHSERYLPEEAELEALAVGLCGAKVLRMDFLHRLIQPQKDAWNFSDYDRLVDVFGRNGVEIAPILQDSPKWASSQTEKPKTSSRRVVPDYDVFAAFAARVAKRYQGKIRYFEIWNEPDLVAFANFPAKTYMELLKRCYDAIKKVSPDALVLNGGIATVISNDSDEPRHNPGLLDLLRADGGKSFDLFAYHGHGNFYKYVDHLEVLRKHGLIGPGSPRPWYSNETAETAAGIGECNQADSLFRKLLYARANGAMGYTWFRLRDPGHLPLGHYERHFGLITPEFEPKPVYVTYNMLARVYGQSRFLRMVDSPPGVYACLFENPAGEALLALWNTGLERAEILKGLPRGTTKIDRFGNETPLLLKDGMTFLRIARQPFTLRMPALPKEAVEFAGQILAGSLPRQFAVPSGGSAELVLQFANPLSQALTLELRADAPEKIRIAPVASTISLPPGGKKAVRLNLTGEKGFQANAASSALLHLAFTPKGMPTEVISLPVVTQSREGEPLFRLDEEENYYSLVPSAPGNEPFYWKGASDLSASVFLSRSGSELRLRAEVQDDSHVQPFTGKDSWKGDGIQFGFRIPGQNTYWKFDLAKLADGNSFLFCSHAPKGFSDPVSKMRLDVSRDEKTRKTIYTLRIPFRSVGMTPKAAADGFRFNLIVNDNDGEMREGFLFASSGLGNSENDEVWPLVNLP